ncbi:protein export chaperone SecB [uncultured Pseudoteredinibacter sp.]|uniref:protein export chaperone SecB n=1 Tax=uncultured Pseudoteredinibacter sp. TaxID=1641701 RepID=UPI00261944FE|nr:protein export chaperone SecB [uncultured Pseudoteredinibacter sp.]
MKQWCDIKNEFDTDGSLRDIYVENIDSAVWNDFIGEVKRSKYKFEFSHGDVEKELPFDLNAIKSMQQADPTTLYIWVTDNIQLNCHFFVETEIELDVSPHDIQTESAYSQLVAFLKWLATVTKSEVKLTHEGIQEQVILSVC